MVDVFAEQTSVMIAAHDKAKAEFPEHHARFAKAQARIRKHEEFIELAESTTERERMLLATRNGNKLQSKRWGVVGKTVHEGTKIVGDVTGINNINKALSKFAGKITDLGDGLQEVGGVVVKAAAQVGDMYRHVSKHVTKAIAKAGEAATNWAKAGYQWAENAANDIAQFAIEVTNFVKEFAMFIWDLMSWCVQHGRE